MKLVINISEEFYNVLVDESYDSIRNIPLEHMDLVQKIKNGKPFDSVFDKIRAEIEFEVDHRTNMLCAEDVFEIIDKYKAESEET